MDRFPSGTTPTTVDVGPNGFTVAIYLSDARSIDAVLTNRDAGLAAHMLAISSGKMRHMTFWQEDSCGASWNTQKTQSPISTVWKTRAVKEWRVPQSFDDPF